MQGPEPEQLSTYRSSPKPQLSNALYWEALQLEAMRSVVSHYLTTESYGRGVNIHWVQGSHPIVRVLDPVRQKLEEHCQMPIPEETLRIDKALRLFMMARARDGDEGARFRQATQAKMCTMLTMTIQWISTETEFQSKLWWEVFPVCWQGLVRVRARQLSIEELAGLPELFHQTYYILDRQGEYFTGLLGLWLVENGSISFRLGDLVIVTTVDFLEKHPIIFLCAREQRRHGKSVSKSEQMERSDSEKAGNFDFMRPYDWNK